jgi:hypothetical protein
MGNVLVPDAILRTYRRVTMGADVMYVNKIPFLGNSSRHLHFGTAEVLVNLKHSTILNAIKGVQSVYEQLLEICSITTEVVCYDTVIR